LKYIQNKKLGFDKEQVVVIQRTWELREKREAFKNELLQYPAIINVAYSDAIPGRMNSNSIYQPEGRTANEQNLLWQFPGDDDLVETLKLEITHGRDFSQKFTSDTLSILLNESAVEACGLSDPIGKRLIQIGGKPEDNRYLTIVGILKDFHFESLHQKIRPLIMLLNRGPSLQMLARIQPENITSTLKVIENKWKQFVPGKPFNFFFLDDDYNQLYQAEQRTGQIFTAFSILAILIACLGLFGLASFTAEQRTKEIGIRKILGASIGNIIFNLTKEFSKWVLIANLVAWPIAYFIMNNWLQNFAYRINLNLWIFLFAAIIALFIALTTVSFQAIKAALTNPVEALRYE
jgi:putative ABC transport system permease protein